MLCTQHLDFTGSKQLRVQTLNIISVAKICLYYYYIIYQIFLKISVDPDETKSIFFLVFKLSTKDFIVSDDKECSRVQKVSALLL